jgi:hypothetical protein
VRPALLPAANYQQIYHNQDLLATGVAADPGTMNDQPITIGERHGWTHPKGHGNRILMPQTNRTPDFGALFYTAKRMICHFYFHPICAGKTRNRRFLASRR